MQHCESTTYARDSSPLPSNRRFGLTLGCVALAFGVGSFFTGGSWPVLYLYSFAAVFLIVGAFVFPAALGPFNRAWAALGDILGRIVQPIVLGLIFLVIVTPLALISRRLGRDELKLKRGQSDTYWVSREHPIESSSFRNQF